MTARPVATLEAARRVLAFCVLNGATVRVMALVPDGGAKIAVQPPGILSPEIRAYLGLPLVRREIARHMERGAVRFSQGAPDAHSLSGTAAGFAHLSICLLTPDQRDLFLERAAVREFDGGLSRPRAELLALFDTLDHASVIEATAAVCAA